MTRMRATHVIVPVAALVLVACGAETDATPATTAPATETVAATDANATPSSAATSSGTPTAALTATGSDYLGDYTLVDEEFGTMTQVSVTDATRTIESNALPNHDTGEFPNAGNPNSISEQDTSYTFPLDATWTGTATEVRTPGVAVNGVKFEPGTAETVTCDSGELYRIEALQNLYDLGLDMNNAHVQPTGEYHYHGVSELLVGAFASDEDLVHVGFAADGYLIYASKSDAYSPSYELSTVARSGTGCTASGPAGGTETPIDGTAPDGTYTSDWTYVDGSGDLDECNGTTVDGEYAYFITDGYPFVSRCLFGEFTEAGPGGGPPPGG